MISAFQDIEDRRNRILHFGRDRIIVREIGVAGLHRRCVLDARVALKRDRADRDRRQPEDAMPAFDIASTAAVSSSICRGVEAAKTLLEKKPMNAMLDGI